MPFKINISKQGKALKIEAESEALIGKKIGETMQGEEISPELAGYELEITGTSDIAGFPGKKDVEGINLKRVLLSRGFGMKENRPKGLRKKKTVRGNLISKDVVQINLKVLKEGSKKFEDLIPKKEPEKTEGTTEQSTEEKPSSQ